MAKSVVARSAINGVPTSRRYGGHGASAFARWTLARKTRLCVPYALLLSQTQRTKGLIMQWLNYLAWFFGGAFLVNTIPHVVAGVSGRPFQSPFATPRGKGLSSSTVNVIWGFVNLAISYLLICRVGDFELRSAGDIATLGLGGLMMAIFLARRFGDLHGGNTPLAK